MAIFCQCADEDLVHRLSGLKQHPVTGQLYSGVLLKNEDLLNKKKEKKDEEAEDEEEQVWCNGKHILILTLKYFGFECIKMISKT